mgnify:CR=1 FL=1
MGSEMCIRDRDSSRILKVVPAVVVRPHSTLEVAKVVKLANEEKIPVVPRGGATSLVGGAVPPKEESIVIDLTGMDKIMEISIEDLRAEVEAGVIHAKLEEELAKYNLFWPPDPGSSDNCTVGGVLAMNAGGMRAVKYGTARNWVLGLKVVLPTGDIIKTGAKTIKSNVGYDLTRLFVGSEGTLGIITEASLRVVPLPESIARVSAFFDKIEDAGRAVVEVFKTGVVPLIMELADRNIIRAVNKWLNLNLPEKEAYMLVDVDGTPEQVAKLAQRVGEALKRCGGTDIGIATDKEEMEKLYMIRERGPTALPNITGKMNLTQDFCVPLSKLPQAFRGVYEISEKLNIPVAIVSHAGDGNVHPIFSIDLEAPDAHDVIKNIVREICKLALRLGGTISGEHGIGITKAPYLEMELTSTEINIQKEIKKIFDPKGILNPGKIFLS